MFCKSLKIFFSRAIDKVPLHVENTHSWEVNNVAWGLNHTMK